MVSGRFLVQNEIFTFILASVSLFIHSLFSGRLLLWWKYVPLSLVHSMIVLNNINVSFEWTWGYFENNKKLSMNTTRIYFANISNEKVKDIYYFRLTPFAFLLNSCNLSWKMSYIRSHRRADKQYFHSWQIRKLCGRWTTMTIIRPRIYPRRAKIKRKSSHRIYDSTTNYWCLFDDDDYGVAYRWRRELHRSLIRLQMRQPLVCDTVS